MSLVDLYAVEAKFSQTKKEYDSLMRTMKYQCLGKNKSTQKCQKAAELNAQLQTYLIQISNLLVILRPNLNQRPTIHEQQQQILSLADYLEKDKNELTTTIASKEDAVIFAKMNEYHYLAWFMCSILVFSGIVYQMKKI
jgi:hypothetical protein